MGAVSVEAPSQTDWIRSPSGLVLFGLLALVLLSAVACPRDPDRLSTAERTTLQASRSLRIDRDLVFDGADRERLQSWSWVAEDLALAPTRDGGRRFAANPVYPLLLAPITGVAPLRGPAVVNALLLALTAWAAATTLAQRLGRAGAAVVALCVFASVVYRSVFLISPVMLLAAAVALAMRLALRHEEPGAHGLREIYRPLESAPVSTLRAIVVGALVGLMAVHHPLFLLVLAPVWTAIPRAQRRSGALGSGVGAVLILAAVWLTFGLWGQPAAGVSASPGELGSPATVGLAAWNALYFAIGRNVGLVPYFLPFVALLGLWKGGAGRSVLVVTALVGSLAPLILTPFNFFSGPAAVGSAWLIPWFVLLWFVPTEPLPRGWLPATLLLAIPAMYPTWLAPEIEPVTASGITRQSAGRWHRHLPPETTQRALPPGEVMGNRFWIRSLNLEARVSGASRWLLSGKGWVELHLAAPEELAALHLQFGPQAAAELEVEGAELGDMILLPDGGVGFRLERPKRRGLHPMWWSDERYHNYVVRFRMPMAEARSQTLSITAIAANMERANP